MPKHAFCILAHTDPYCLRTLLRLIDHPDNHIFIHIDRKANRILFSSLKTRFSPMTVLPENESVKVSWGGLSGVEAELIVFERALASGIRFSYMHLLSGQDLPLKNPEDMHRFFDAAPQGTNFIDFSADEENLRNLRSKTIRYVPFTNHLRPASPAARILYGCLRHGGLLAQKALGIHRNWNGIKLYKGANWVSVTPDFARYLVEHKGLILRKFKGVSCADEIYKQTLFMASPYKDTLHLPTDNDLTAGTRLIDWEHSDIPGSPHIWRKRDFETLTESGAIFARKFSSDTDREIIDRISAWITTSK